MAKLEVASSAKAMSLLIEHNAGTLSPNPAREINKFVKAVMKQNVEFKSAQTLLNQSLGQLLVSFDSFSARTLTPVSRTPTANKPLYDHSDLLADLENTTAAPVRPTQNDWNFISSSKGEEETAPPANNNASTSQRKRGRENH
ncbi:hypothetical protein DUNSADRAFT_12567 [Dunaliella salina]|uniref:Encoded protein n=1 Tax=Dunaliella salina TaxID=3046 RepID=A0ABQ7GB28_DUNSA|nr:hypothetical protein DUNSADRAFT_12567 [Dunaliella salina]|eukprot:KAF5831799.1 hypothetical protein DUNSADRAFT_12567 [Dunaliella salina]